MALIAKNAFPTTTVPSFGRIYQLPAISKIFVEHAEFLMECFVIKTVCDKTKIEQLLGFNTR